MLMLLTAFCATVLLANTLVGDLSAVPHTFCCGNLLLLGLDTLLHSLDRTSKGNDF